MLPASNEWGLCSLQSVLEDVYNVVFSNMSNVNSSYCTWAKREKRYKQFREILGIPRIFENEIATLPDLSKATFINDVTKAWIRTPLSIKQCKSYDTAKTSNDYIAGNSSF